MSLKLEFFSFCFSLNIVFFDFFSHLIGRREITEVRFQFNGRFRLSHLLCFGRGIRIVFRLLAVTVLLTVAYRIF